MSDLDLHDSNLYTDSHASLHRLKPHPVILIGHFFAVALYAIYHTFKSCQLWSIPRGIYRAVMIFSRACMVIFPLMGSELLSLV